MGRRADGPVFERDRPMHGCGFALGVVSAVAVADTAAHVQPHSLGAATTAYNTACAHVCMLACMRSLNFHRPHRPGGHLRCHAIGTCY